MGTKPTKKVAVTGSAGRLGSALVDTLLAAGHEVVRFTRHNLPMAEPNSAATILRNTEFDLLINPAAITAVDYCENHKTEARHVNVDTPALFAAECRRRGAKLIHISTDYVFDGHKPGLLTENDPATPVGIYAASKRAGEIAILQEDPTALVARVSWVFGPARPSFPDSLLAKSLTGDSLSAVADKWACPTFAPDAAQWLLSLINIEAATGILHLCNSGLITWRDYAAETIQIAAQLGLPVKSTEVSPQNRADIPAFTAPRPAHTGMNTQRFTSLTGITPRPWQHAMRDHIRAVHLT